MDGETFDWLGSFTEETFLLKSLKEAARASREAAAVSPVAEWQELLDREARLCGRLEAARARRLRHLAAVDRQPSDILHMALASQPPEMHDKVLAIFSRFVDAAAEANREIEINRIFFKTASSAVHDAIELITGGSGCASTYGEDARTGDRRIAVCLSTTT